MAEDRARLRSDSVAARQIVRSFLDFIRSVDVAAGVDPEGLEVAVECLTEVFDLRRSGSEDFPKISLIDVFTQSQKRSKEKASTLDGLKSKNVFQQFVEGLESAGFFSSDNNENRMSQAESTFQETLKGYKGQDECELLAESFKSQGNKAMAGHRYVEAIELYTLAISMSSNNAIYFANRAAAHTQTGNHAAAITDCQKAIEINPRYSKAYSRLGLVHYSQGRYLDAVDWFTKALELDPSNASASDNLESAKQKLLETVQGSGKQQDRHAEVPSVAAQSEPSNNDEPCAANSETRGGVTSEEEASQHQDQSSRQQGDNAGDNQSRATRPELQPNALTDLLQSVMQGISQGGGVELNNLVPEVANFVQAFGGFPGGNPSPDSSFDFPESLQSAIRGLGIQRGQQQADQSSQHPNSQQD